MINPQKQLSYEVFKPFQEWISKECGLHFEFKHHEGLRLALQERMRARNLFSLEDYYEFLLHDTHQQETQRLIQRLTIGETYFFRNTAQFEALEQHILPKIVQERFDGNRKLTVWSAACSTGEEPYSLAISLLEALPDDASWEVSILATDINLAQLETAKKGVYGPRAVREVSSERLKKYFSLQDGKYILSDSVKEKVTFAPHNLVKDPYVKPEMSHVDLIFCRNVMIYFSLATIRNVLENLYHCLDESGYLFIGDAELLWYISDRFVPVEFPHALLYRKQSKQTSFAVPASPASAFIPIPSMDTVQKNDTSLSQQAVLLADQGEYEKATKILNRIVQKDTLSAEAYYLLGVLYHKQKRYKSAIDAFQRALYVDPSLDLAYVSLANIYLYLHETDKAIRSFQNALKSLEAKPEEESVRFSTDTPVSYLRAVCYRSLEQLLANSKNG